MLSSKWVSAAIALSTFALASPARADYPNPALYLGVFGGANLTLQDWNLGDGARLATSTSPKNLPSHGPIVGARLGWQMMPHAALEGEVAWLPVTSTAGQGNNFLSWDLNLVVNILKSNWTPLVEAGAGSYHALGGGDLGSGTSLRAHFGLGVRGLLTRWLALRLDVRDVVGVRGFTRQTDNNLEILLGLDFFVWRGQGYGDKDGDGVRDGLDACPDLAGPESNKGCPLADRDRDGVADAADVCPDVPAGGNPDPRRPGCPGDSDKDGVLDNEDLCPRVPAGKSPDPGKPGCPLDQDGDGIGDADDKCPAVPAGKQPDPLRAGCPADADNDGVGDLDDKCPEVPAGKYPDPQRPGCPADRDGDGVLDQGDACIDVPAGRKPDAKRAGCPADSDGDSIPDEVDACPDKVGAPNPDPKKNGCPGLVKIENGQIVILDQVYFATAKDTILPRSFPVLEAVQHALNALPAGRSVRVEGHTDDKGDAKKNLDLSQRRAEAVKKWLVDKGIPATRLVAEGKGSKAPIADNKTDAGRARNRRVEFHIVDAK